MRRNISGALAAIALATLAGAGAPTSSPRVMPIEITEMSRARPEGTTSLVRIRVPWPAIDAARGDLANLDIRDENDSRVPYALVESGGEEAGGRLLRSVATRREGNVTHYLFEASPSAGPSAARLHLEVADAAFDAVVTVSLSSSASGAGKVAARDVPIFRRAGGENTRLEIPVTDRPWRFLDLAVTPHDPDHPVGVTGAHLVALSDAGTGLETFEAPVVSRIDGAEQSWLRLLLPYRNLEVEELIVTAGPGSDRRAPVSLAAPTIAGGEMTLETLASGELFFSGSSAASALKVGAIIPSQEIVLVVENGHERPLDLRAVRVLVRRPSLELRIGPGTTMLRAFHGPGTVGTRVESVARIAGAGEPVLRLSDDAVSVGPSAPNASAHVPDASLVPYLGGAIDTAPWGYRKPVRVTDAGVSRVELDAEAVALSRRDGGDLRIVDGDRQVPYIVYRSGIPATLRPEVRRAASGRISRWELVLPAAHLPITQISARTPSAIFRRSVRLLERVENESGKTVERELGQEFFAREGVSGQDLILSLRATPQTATLIVEVDNGDNAELLLEDFTVFYPSLALLFRHALPGAPQLYFGNPEAEAPAYDLELIKSHILAASPSDASLGPLESANKRPWWESKLSRPAAWWAYWGALGLVVVALIVVIARLTKPKAV